MITSSVSIPEAKLKKVSYINSLLNNSECRSEAMATLLYRMHPPQGSAITIPENVATVTLIFPSTVVSATCDSVGRGLNGHSERRALALAINTAIAQKSQGFENLSPITELSAPESEVFQKYIESLKTLTSIRIYTERVPCTSGGTKRKRDQESCNQFFGRIFEGIDYTFYYSIELKQGPQMNANLEEQFGKAKKFYEKSLEHKEQMQNLEKARTELKSIQENLDLALAQDRPMPRAESNKIDALQKRRAGVNKRIALLQRKSQGIHEEILAIDTSIPPIQPNSSVPASTSPSVNSSAPISRPVVQMETAGLDLARLTRATSSLEYLSQSASEPVRQSLVPQFEHLGQQPDYEKSLEPSESEKTSEEKTSARSGLKRTYP